MVREVAGSKPGLRQDGISLAYTCGSVRDAETYSYSLNRWPRSWEEHVTTLGD